MNPATLPLIPRYPVHKANEIDFTKIEVSDPISDIRGAHNVYINYNDNSRTNKLLVQTDKFVLKNGGVTRITNGPKQNGLNETKWSENREAFYDGTVKMIFDCAQKSLLSLKNHLSQADKLFGSDKVKKQLFGKKWNSCDYIPCVKQDNFDGYCVMDLNLVPIGENYINRTKLHRINGINKKIVRADHAHDIEKMLKYFTELRIIFYYCRLHIFKNKETLEYNYELCLKLMAIEYMNDGHDLLPAFPAPQILIELPENEVKEIIKPRYITDYDDDNYYVTKPINNDLYNENTDTSDDEENVISDEENVRCETLKKEDIDYLSENDE